jgi:hypothetical protein
MSGTGKKSVKYLGNRATDKAHIREIMRKANKVMGTGERKWGVISGGE